MVQGAADTAIQGIRPDKKQKMFDSIPRIFAINFNICFLITSSKPFGRDYTEFEETSKTKNISKGNLEHVHNKAITATRYEIPTYYVYKTLDGFYSKFYMAFLNKDGKLMDSPIEFYIDERWAYLFQPLQKTKRRFK